MSGMISERSANRGSCAQSCRKDYVLNDAATGAELDRGYLISAKDLGAWDHLAEIAEAGIGCLKIEGRKKKPEFVATVTRGYREFLKQVENGEFTPPTFEEVQPLVPALWNPGGEQPRIVPTATSSGRRSALAHWLTSEKNPLTARVYVNRVWSQYFSQGIVATVQDFGRAGARPTHPELLDHLAAGFMQQGWSIKKLHREILLSSVYRQSSAERADALKLDPDSADFSERAIRLGHLVAAAIQRAGWRRVRRVGHGTARRTILALRVLGSACTKRTRAGRNARPSSSAVRSAIAAASSSSASCPGLSTQMALTTMPRSSSGTPITPHSATAGWRSRASSTSGPPTL